VAYFPGSPDTWSGSIALVAQENVQPLNVSFAEVLGICERLGRDSRSHLNEVIVDGANRDRADVHRSSV
jgi:hypothetical protein